MNRVSDYMRFAKLETAAPYVLASSGVLNASLADLGPLPDLNLHGDNAYGYQPLLEAIAGRFNISSKCVVTAQGTAFANHLAFAALLNPGDEVLVETPTYSLLTDALAYLQADIRTFERRAPDWALDPAAVPIGERTKLIVLTDLHNPTSAPADPSAVQAIAAAAARVGAVLLVDEVYLELLFDPPRTAFREGSNIVVTSSLTKAYGVSGLRCGWILANPDLTERMWRLNDLYGSTPVHIGLELSAAAFKALPGLRARASELLDANRAAYRDILGGHPALEQTIFGHGTTVFPRLLNEDGDSLYARLKADHETTVVPGRFFGAPDHIRIGLGGEVAQTREALQRLARALG